MSENTPAPVLPSLFRPDPCSPNERGLRLIAGLIIWVIGLAGAWLYAELADAPRQYYGPGISIERGFGATLLGLVSLLVSPIAVLVNGTRDELVKPSFLVMLAIPWAIISLIILSQGSTLRHIFVVVGFLYLAMMTLVALVGFDGDHDSGFIRGARLVSLPRYLRILTTHLAREGADPDLVRAVETRDKTRSVLIAGAPLPPGNETLHTLLCASTGAGKSVTLRALLDKIRARGERAIVLDNGHEFHRRLGRPDDIVMGPLANTHGWAIANEIREPYEWARFARSVIPDGHGESRSWHDYAQRFFANLGEALGPNAGNRELVEALTVWTPARLAPLLSDTTSAVMLQEGGERLLTNVRSIFSGYLQGWKYTPEGAFSFRTYMSERDDRAWLWIPYRESELGVARGLVTCWTDTLVTAAFDRPEGGETTWIVIDELDSLGELSSLIEATTKLRKRHVAIVAAIQSLSQLATHYGPDKVRTLLNCFSNLLVLRSVEPDTAEALSRHLGEREYWEESHSESTSSGSLGRDSSSTTRTRRQTRIVLPSEIQSLPDLHGFLKPAGPWPVVRVEAELPQT